MHRGANGLSGSTPLQGIAAFDVVPGEWHFRSSAMKPLPRLFPRSLRGDWVIGIGWCLSGAWKSRGVLRQLVWSAFTALV